MAQGQSRPPSGRSPGKSGRPPSARARKEEPPEEPDENDLEGEEGYEDEEGENALATSLLLTRSSAILVSVGIHATILIIMAFMVITTIKEEQKAILLARQERRKQEYDPKKKRAMEKTPEIKAEKIVEKPIIVLEEEVEITKDIPKGTDMSNQSNKNLESTSVVDAYGVGGGAAGAYGHRLGKGALANEGGSEGTEAAVYAALLWLKRHQDADGRWDVDGFERNCGREEMFPGRCAGPGGKGGNGHGFQNYDVGVTGLALLAFLGNGNTHRHGDPEFKKVVRSGLKFLQAEQNQGGDLDGALGWDPGHGESIYNHAIATMALCEAYAVSRDQLLREPAQRAVDFVVKCQNVLDADKEPDAARRQSLARGWKYGVRPGKSDTSVTGWMVLALKAAKVAELEVPEIAFVGARNWFDEATDGEGRTGYNRAGVGSSFLQEQEGMFRQGPCMTAVAVICRMFTGQERKDKVIQKGLDILVAELPTWDEKARPSPINMYYWYYGTYAVFHATRRGEANWEKWNRAMQDALLPSQQGGKEDEAVTCLDGSWHPIGEWGLAGGRVYATAINALTLEIYYRYERGGAH